MTDGATPSDADLAARAAAGDQRAYAELVGRHKDGLFRLLRRFTGNPDEAYEATQEAFIAAWSALRRYDSSRPFPAWLRTIAINKARDRGRRAAVRRRLFGTRSFEDTGALAEPAPGQAADEGLIERQDLLQLDRAITQLPTGLRAALVLTAFDGFSQREAGEILGVSAKTVETRAYRARQLLAARLDPQLRPAR